MKEARADTAPVPLGPVGPRRRRRLTAVLVRLRRADQTAAQRPGRRHERGRLLPGRRRRRRRHGPMAEAVVRHGAGGRRGRGAESGLRARHRRADAADALASAARRPCAPPTKPRLFGIGLAALGILLLVRRTNVLAALLALATLVIYLVDLHAAQAAIGRSRRWSARFPGRCRR